MSDTFTPIGITNLMTMILNNEKQGHIFGIPIELIFKPSQTDRFRIMRYGVVLESPIGVAAGPHTQLAQNIISSWLCGARYIELKTIQTLDELEITKPCIDMQDEGYNCEWSQELKIRQSFDEYLNAWILIHLLKHKFDMDMKITGMLFNMSVGYNMDGILKDNVQWFFEKMKNCHVEKEEKINELSIVYPAIRSISIPDCISDNITLSTMHGCPPDEIEKIGLYLIAEKKLHTTIKLNPTLIGQERLRSILNTVSGFKTEVPEIAFEHDLKYDDALKIIDSLDKSAKENNVFFGLKLTNTLESINHRNVLPEKESMVYMSGRALHPISINLAAKLRNHLGNTINISFSAGADCFNITKLLSCDMKPVTVCSDILKPGGYGRLRQYITKIQEEMELLDSDNLENFIMKHAGTADLSSAIKTNTCNYALEVMSNKAYKKDPFFAPNIKTHKQLRFFDCIHAPCVDSCPTNQDIPEYLWYASQAKWDEALKVILKKNPMPSVLGMACDHLCQAKCTRTNYDSSILIRDIKRFITEQAINTIIPKAAKDSGLKAAIIGAGPSGLSCAFYLRLAGFAVDIFETKSISGGMVSDAIPSFRLTEEAIQKDIARIKSTGVVVHYNKKINTENFKKLQEEYNYIYIAIGAQQAKKMNIENEQTHGVIDPLKFLSIVKRTGAYDLGKNIIVIGGGNTAVDVARTALRLVGSDGKVQLIYRRTCNEMPADADEIKDLLRENIEIIELAAPQKVIVRNNKVFSLLCSKMELKGKDDSGRLKPVKIKNSEFELVCDTIIPALGQDRVLDFIDDSLIEADDSGKTRMNNVFIGGDANKGAATIVKAVGDGRRVAESIISAAVNDYNITKPETDKSLTYRELMIKKSIRIHGIEPYEMSAQEKVSFNLTHQTLNEDQSIQEASRCLYCDEACSICVTVCPNRANVAYEITPVEINLKKAVKSGNQIIISDDKPFIITQKFQVLNLNDFCNECGNCTTFCPTSGSPFRDKPRFCLSDESFSKESNAYIFKVVNEDFVLFKKENSSLKTLYLRNGDCFYDDNNYSAILDGNTFELKKVTFKNDYTEQAEFIEAAEMFVLYNAAKYI